MLAAHRFPAGPVYHRQPGVGWGPAVARAAPDVLVEDDCESIGGTGHMTYPDLSAEQRTTIASVVVAEFAGIDHLPDDLSQRPDSRQSPG